MAKPNIPWLPASLLPSGPTPAVNLPDEYNRTTATDEQLKDQLEAERKKNYRSGRTVILEDGRVVPEEEEQQALADIKAKKELAKWEKGISTIQNITDMLTLGGAGVGAGVKAASGYMNKTQPVRMIETEQPEKGVAQAIQEGTTKVPTTYDLYKKGLQVPLAQRDPYVQAIKDIFPTIVDAKFNTFYENPETYSPWKRTPDMRPVAEATPRQHLHFAYQNTLTPEQVEQNLIPSANYFRPVEQQITKEDLDRLIPIFTAPKRASGGASADYFYGTSRKPNITLYPENILQTGGGPQEVLDITGHEFTHGEQTARNRAAGTMLQRVLNPPEGVSLVDKPYVADLYSDPDLDLDPTKIYYRYEPHELQEFIWSPMKRFSSRAGMLYGVHGTPEEQMEQVKGFINNVFNDPQLFYELGQDLYQQQFGPPPSKKTLDRFIDKFYIPFLLDVLDDPVLQKEAIKGAMAEPIKKENKYG